MIDNFANSNEYREVIHGLIPGGAHTYSKGDDQFPILSPAAIERGSGAYVWDIDGNRFVDCAMGLTSVSLGHAFEPVLARVRAELEKGVNFQRPSVIERVIAEKFLAEVPQHDRIKFCKNGSTATTAAIKLARAATGKSIVVFPKEQPFFSYDDWFIGSTPCDSGIPDQGRVHRHFSFGDLESLREVLKDGQVAAVISEPGKSNSELSQEYLEGAIKLAHQYGALFILDEMITGFKVDFPGVLTKFNLQPDFTTWGKGIANGFSFCALTGKAEYMDLGGIKDVGKEKVFLVSTTHGGETHAIAAGIATLDFFKSNEVIEHNLLFGEKLIGIINGLIKREGLEGFVGTNETPWFLTFSFRDKNGAENLEYRTFFSQEMIKKGVLFGGLITPCYCHEEEHLKIFKSAFEHGLKQYKVALEKGVRELLVGPAVKPVFRRFV